MTDQRPPLLNVVAQRPLTLSPWRQEAIAMRDAGVALRKIGLTLPAESLVRQDLLETASDCLAFARLRGEGGESLVLLQHG